MARSSFRSISYRTFLAALVSLGAAACSSLFGDDEPDDPIAELLIETEREAREEAAREKIETEQDEPAQAEDDANLADTDGDETAPELPEASADAAGPTITVEPDTDSEAQPAPSAKPVSVNEQETVETERAEEVADPTPSQAGDPQSVKQHERPDTPSLKANETAEDANERPNTPSLKASETTGDEVETDSSAPVTVEDEDPVIVVEPNVDAEDQNAPEAETVSANEAESAGSEPDDSVSQPPPPQAEDVETGEQNAPQETPSPEADEAAQDEVDSDIPAPTEADAEDPIATVEPDSDSENQTAPEAEQVPANDEETEDTERSDDAPEPATPQADEPQSDEQNAPPEALSPEVDDATLDDAASGIPASAEAGADDPVITAEPNADSDEQTTPESEQVPANDEETEDTERSGDASTAAQDVSPEAPSPTENDAPTDEAETKVSAIAEDETPAFDANIATPPLWRVTDDDSEFWLFGTFHILPPDVEWRQGVLDAVLQGAATFYFEVDGDAPDAQSRTLNILMTKGFNTPGETLSNLLSADDAQRLTEIAAELGAPMAALDPMRPWQAFLALSVQFIINQGFEPGKGADNVLIAEARTRGKDLKFFESIEEQLGFFTELPPEIEKELLVSTLRDWEEQKAGFDGLFEAWRTGDIAVIDQNMNETIRENAPEVFQVLIVDRNKAWGEMIANDMREGSGVALVAVGAAHMAGEEDSLPALLAADGFTVERYDYAQTGEPSADE